MALELVKNFTLLLCALSLVLAGKPSPKGIFEVFKTTCTSYVPFVPRFDCDVQRLADKSYVFNGYAIFSKDLAEKFQVKLVGDVLLMHAKKSIHALDLRLNTCESLNTILEISVLRNLMTEMRRTSNFPFKCPFKANTLYGYRNFSSAIVEFPKYTPDVNFTFAIQLYDEGVLIADQVTTGKVTFKRFESKDRSKKH